MGFWVPSSPGVFPGALVVGRAGASRVAAAHTRCAKMRCLRVCLCCCALEALPYAGESTPLASFALQDRHLLCSMRRENDVTVWYTTITKSISHVPKEMLHIDLACRRPLATARKRSWEQECYFMGELIKQLHCFRY